MTAQWLILTAAAGAILLALCAMFWALAQRRQSQARINHLLEHVARLEASAETAQASAEAFDSALLAVEDGRALLASGEESLEVCIEALGLGQADPQGVVAALMRADPDHARRLAEITAEQRLHVTDGEAGIIERQLSTIAGISSQDIAETRSLLLTERSSTRRPTGIMIAPPIP